MARRHGRSPRTLSAVRRPWLQLLEAVAVLRCIGLFAARNRIRRSLTDCPIRLRTDGDARAEESARYPNPAWRTPQRRRTGSPERAAPHCSTSVEPEPGILAPSGVAVLENALAHHRSSRLHYRNFREYLERHFAPGGTDKRRRRSRANHVSSRLTAFLVAVRDRSRTEDIRETTGQRS